MKLLLLVAALAAVCVAQQNPEGQWNAPLSGGNLFICQSTESEDSPLFTGAYSEKGYIRGDWNGEVFDGIWAEPGLTTTFDGVEYNATGTFQVTLTPDGRFFVGTICFSDAPVCQSWGSERVSFLTPTDEQCWRGSWANDEILVGQYDMTALNNTGHWIITQDEDNLFSASFWAAPYINYAEGTCDASGKICRGQFISEVYYGSVLFVIGTEGRIWWTMWQGYHDDIDFENRNNPELHDIGSGVTTSTDTDLDGSTFARVLIVQGSFVNEISREDMSAENNFFVTTHIQDLNQSADAFREETYIIRGNFNNTMRTLEASYVTAGLGREGSNIADFGSATLFVSRDWTEVLVTFEPGDVNLFVRRVYDDWLRPSDEDAVSNSADPDASPTGEWFAPSGGLASFYACVDDFGVVNGSLQLTNSGPGPFYGQCDDATQTCRGIHVLDEVEGIWFMAITGDNTARFEFYATDVMLPDQPERNVVELNRTQGVVPTQEQCHMYWGVLFGGLFNDPIYKSTMSVCVDQEVASGDWQISGLYSRIGVTRGVFVPRTLSWHANWYEAGIRYGDRGSVNGGVIFTLIDFYNFNGRYTLNNENTGLTFAWPTVTRIEYTKQTNEQCWQVTSGSSVSLAGVYSTSVADRTIFCQDNIFFAASYNTTLDQSAREGFADGLCSFDDKVCHGEWFLDNGVQGISIYSLLNAETMVRSEFIGNWQTPQFDPNEQIQSGAQRTISLPRTSFEASQADCEQNLPIRPPTPTPSPPPSPGDITVSSAGKVVAALWVSFLGLLIQFLF